LFGKLTQEFYRKKIFRDHKTNHPATQNIVMAALQTTLEQTLHFGESASNELNLFIQCFKPMTEKTASGLKLLKNGFRLADPNGNGMCSLAELDCFVKTQLLSIYPENQGKVAKELYKYYRPCYIRAYNDAKDYKKDDGTVIAGTEDCTADDFVSKGEFRLFCAYLCIYAAMFDGFSKIDGYGAGKEGDDRKIDLNEWISGFLTVQSYGFIGLANIDSVETATEVFNLMDKNGGGVVMLDEWCTYIKNTEIEASTPLGMMLNLDE